MVFLKFALISREEKSVERESIFFSKANHSYLLFDLVFINNKFSIKGTKLDYANLFLR